MASKKVKTAGMRLGKAVPGNNKPFDGAARSKDPMLARPGGTGNRQGPVKSYAK